MKKVLVFTVIVLATVFLVSCSGEPEAAKDPQTLPDNTPAPVTNNNSDPTPPPAANDNGDDNNGPDDNTPAAPPAFFYKIGDVVVNLDENISYVVDRVGEPQEILVMPSCAFDGDDRIYRYPGAQLFTYPVGDDDFIHTIVIYDDTVRTPEGGIRLGSNLQAVLDAYGDDYKFESDMYTFTRGDTLLEFLILNDVVDNIQYRLDIEIQVG